MALTFNGTTAFLEFVGNLTPAKPYTIFAWVRPANVTQSAAIVSMGKWGADKYTTMLQIAAVSRAQERNAVTSRSVSNTSGFVTNTWTPVVAWFASDSLRRVCSGTGPIHTATDAIVNPVDIFDRLRIGVLGSDNMLRFTGDIAEVAIWSSDLSSDDRILLRDGALPETVSTGTLVEHWSLLENTPTQVGLNGTVLNPTDVIQASTHPLARVAPAPTVSLSGIPSEESFGSLSVTSNGLAAVSLSGIPSEESFGAMVFDSDVANPSFEITANGTNTLYSQPISAFRKGCLYAGWISAEGNVGVTKVDLLSGALSNYILKAAFTADGHNSSTIGFMQDGRVVCMWSAHGDIGRIFFRISTNPYDITAWGAESTVSAAADNSYVIQQYLSLPDRHYVVYRAAYTGSKMRSTRDFSTWDTDRFVITNGSQRPYVLTHCNGVDRIDFLFSTGNPAEIASSIYHAYMLVDSDGVESWFSSNGTPLTTPITPGTGTLVANGTTYSAWNSDIQIDADGYPRVIYQQYIVASSDHRHMFTRWTGLSWTAPVEIAPAGGSLYAAQTYSDGQAVFDSQNLDVVYASVTVGTKKRLREYRTDDNGKTWAFVRDVNTAGDHSDFTPSSPKGHDGRAAVVFDYGSYINFDNINYCSLRAAPSSRISLQLKNRLGYEQVNLSNLQYAVFDTATLGASRKLLARGVDGATDATGTLHVAAPGAMSGAAFLVVSDTDGLVSSDTNAFAGPATVIQ